jgi:polyisoprenoid-binding protein YceI
MSSSTAALQAPPTGRYVIDSASSKVTFVTKHMFGLGKVRGRFAEVQGSIVVTDPVEDSAADAKIAASSFSTRNFIRDGHVKSPLLLSTRRHPTIAFRTDRLRREAGAWTLSGTLTVKGKSAPVELTVTDVDIAGASVVFRARGTVDRYAFGVTAMRGMAARHLSVDLHVHTHMA